MFNAGLKLQRGMNLLLLVLVSPNMCQRACREILGHYLPQQKLGRELSALQHYPEWALGTTGAVEATSILGLAKLNNCCKLAKTLARFLVALHLQ